MGLTPYGVRILEAVMVPPVVYRCLVLMQSVSAFSNKRDFDCVEYFCGQKAITSGMRRTSFRSIGHDYKQDSIDQDFTTARGFITA